MNNVPSEFEAMVYRDRYPDLSALSDVQLRTHFENHGKAEGRSASRIRTAIDLVSLIDPTLPALEIGPFLKPRLHCTTHNVKYFDVLDTSGLIARAESQIARDSPNSDNIRRQIESAPTINYVSPEGDLNVVDETFSTVFSSHCIEHQTNLVKHLNDVASILADCGRYFLIIPDKRFCFDHFIPETSLVDVLAAHVEQPQLHSARAVLQHRLLVTHNNAKRHWDGDHGVPRLVQLAQNGSQFVAALTEAQLAREKYIDVHNWAFTPDGFRHIISELYRVGLIQMSVLRVWPTLRSTFEFMAILQKSV